MAGSQTVSLSRKDLEQVARASLRAARLLMECGARAEVIHEGCLLVAFGLGAERVALRVGYASLDITLDSGDVSIVRMAEVGAIGVNYRLDHAVRGLIRRIGAEALDVSTVLDELDRLERGTPHHAPWLVALAVGIACASFGRLLGVDWPAFLPVAVSGALGQAARSVLLRRKLNPFVTAALAAGFASGLCGLAAGWVGSGSVNAAMIASVLMLVPGVPALNAQFDIMEGYPTLGSARAVSVAMLLLFLATGVLAAQTLLGMSP